MNPYLSIVVAARNDNYGGDFLHRMQVFVSSLLSLWEKYSLNAELIIVEWNPPEDRPRLKNALVWSKCLKPGTVRIIEIPGKIHRQLPNSDRMPMFEYIAKNVGIRRARGVYMLATNPDLLYSEELIAYLASKKLSESCFYRIDRYDFRGSVPLKVRSQAALHFAKRHVYQVNIREDRGRGLRIKIGRLQRWYFLLSGKWPGSYERYEHNKVGKEPVISLNDDNGVYGGIYTNASGDFLLAASSSWAEIRGFPEFTDAYTHLDSYACHQLKALGLEQALFLPPCMIFHTDHQRIEQKSRPKLPLDKWRTDLSKIRRGVLGPAINNENWGLAGNDLTETNIKGEWNPDE